MTLQQNKLIEIVADVCGHNSTIDLSTKLIDLNLDSLDFLELHTVSSSDDANFTNK